MNGFKMIDLVDVNLEKLAQKNAQCALFLRKTKTHIYSFCAVLSCSVLSDSLQPHGLLPARLLCPWNSLGKNTAVGCCAFLQETFPNPGIKSSSPAFRQILCYLSHLGSPRILEWVAYPFSRGSSQPRNQTRVSCIAGGYFTS